MDKWINAKDRLPAIMEDVLTWDRLAVCQGYYRQDGKWITVNSDGFGSTVKPCDVTHWMPLPESPGITAERVFTESEVRASIARLPVQAVVGTPCVMLEDIAPAFGLSDPA